MISAERLAYIAHAQKVCKDDLPTLGEGVDMAVELEAARTRIAELEAEKSQWAYHVMVPIEEHDRMEAALRAQGLSQEEQAACESGARAIEAWAEDGWAEETDANDIAILRRLGGQTT